MTGARTAEACDTEWVVSPLGQRLTLAQLPPPRTRRWIPRMKAEVVAAVTGGLITLQQALDRYELTLEEYASWQLGVERCGVRGLRTTQAQHYRDLFARTQRF